MSPLPEARSLLLFQSTEGFGASLEAQLGGLGYRLGWCSDLPAFQRLQEELDPAAILVELDPDGHPEAPRDLARLLRSRAPGAPLVLISGRNDLPARLRAVRSGCDLHLAKPLDLHLLVDRLEEVLAPPPPEPERVLLVEDSVAQAGYLASTLRAAGMDVCTLTDPMRTLDELSAFRPDLILMDLYMPRCTGLELASAIRMDPAHVGIPIVFLSSEVERETQLAALGRGADDFLTKPIQPEHLIASVRIRAERTRLLRSLMARDGLTGLLSHSAMKARLEDEWARWRRSGTPMAFALLDLDHFKRINDTHGHPTGDRVLQSLARFLQRRLRRTDLVGRVGGEEFGILFGGSTPDSLPGLLEELRRDFARLEHPTPTGPLRATFSVGITGLPGPATTAAALWETADQALYEAKADGRDCVRRR